MSQYLEYNLEPDSRDFLQHVIKRCKEEKEHHAQTFPLTMTTQNVKKQIMQKSSLNQFNKQQAKYWMASHIKYEEKYSTS